MEWLKSLWRSLFEARLSDVPHGSDMRSRIQFLNIPEDSLLLESKEQPWVVVVSIEPQKQ